MKIQYNRNRYYDYYTGRWLTHDPLGIRPMPQIARALLFLYQYRDTVNLYEYARSSPVMLMDAYGLSADDDFFDFNSFWSLVEAIVSSMPCGKCGSCWKADTYLKELELNTIWTTGFCPPGTGLIVGTPVALGKAGDIAEGLFPAEKTSWCNFPCLCDWRSPWTLEIDDLTVSAPNFGITLYWGIGFSPPGFKFHSDASHQFGCTFHLDFSLKVDIDITKGKCVGVMTWLEL